MQRRRPAVAPCSRTPSARARSHAPLPSNGARVRGAARVRQYLQFSGKVRELALHRVARQRERQRRRVLHSPGCSESAHPFIVTRLGLRP